MDKPHSKLKILLRVMPWVCLPIVYFLGLNTNSHRSDSPYKGKTTSQSGQTQEEYEGDYQFWKEAINESVAEGYLDDDVWRARRERVVMLFNDRKPRPEDDGTRGRRRTIALSIERERIREYLSSLSQSAFDRFVYDVIQEEDYYNMLYVVSNQAAMDYFKSGDDHRTDQKGQSTLNLRIQSAYRRDIMGLERLRKLDTDEIIDAYFFKTS